MPTLKVKLSDGAEMPSYAHEGDACFDIKTLEGGIIPAKGSKTFHTGLSFDIPPGYKIDVFSRSSQGFKFGIRLKNVVGKIDSGYKGELLVALANDSDTDYSVLKGDRIAQAELMPIYKAIFEEVQGLSESDRGTGGFGSSGR
jgi:dUTP pyrophosphatase